MPFIHIKSLPFHKPCNIPHAIESIARDFSEKQQIELRHIHTTWEFYQPGHYARGDKTATTHPETDFPLIVDLLTPDFNNQKTVTSMLETLALSIATHLEWPKDNIFINHRKAYSGGVFDEGEIVHW